MCFTGFFAKLLDVRERPTWREAALLGVWAGLLINAKPVFLVSGLGAGLYILWALRRQWRALLLVSLVSIAAAAPFGAVYLWYNYLRWGSIYFTGYGLAFAGSTIGSAGTAAPPVVPHETPLIGLWGMFMSPGKSIFLYSPPLVLSLLGFLRFFRRFRHVVLAMVLTIGPSLYVHAQMISWAGDFAWGPRYLTFALAVLLVPGAFLLDDLLQLAGRLRRWLAVAGCTAVLGFGVFVTYLGNAIYWDHYIRIEEEAVQGWLGVPNNSGDGISTPGMPCPVCFETIHQLQWVPAFNHIVGNYWLFQHLPKNDNWIVAEADAPWRRYTNLHVNIAQNYARARIDWWFVEYKAVFPTLAWTLVIALPILSVALLLLFLWEIRRSARGLRQPVETVQVAPPVGEPLSAST